MAFLAPLAGAAGGALAGGAGAAGAAGAGGAGGLTSMLGAASSLSSLGGSGQPQPNTAPQLQQYLQPASAQQVSPVQMQPLNLMQFLNGLNGGSY